MNKKLGASFTRLRVPYLVLIFFVFVGFFVAVGSVSFHLLADATISKDRERLQSLADLKAREVRSWVDERQADISSLAANPVFRELLTPGSLPQTGKLSGQAVRAEERVHAWLENIRIAYGYRSIEVCTPNAERLFGTGAPPYSTETIKSGLAQARLSGKATLLDIQMGPDGKPYMAFAAAVRDAGQPSMPILVFSIVLEDKFLPMLDQWANPTRSGELLLFRHSPPQVTVLNKMAPGSREFLHFVTKDSLQPIVQALQQGPGIYAGVDFRRRNVIAAIQPIPELPWWICAKIEESELFEPLNRLATVCGLLSLLGVLASGAMLVLLWSQQSRRVAEAYLLNAKLQSASLEASLATHAKSAFLANMSHEIRTPLNAIVGFTHLLRKRAVPGGWEFEKIEQIALSSQHLLSVINDILDISRIESGKLVLEEVDFMLEDLLLGKVVNIIGQRAQEKGLEVLLDVEPELTLPLRGDPLRIAQSLLNYVANAVKFTDTGRIVIRARKMEEADGSLLTRFEVSDTGIGLTHAQCEKLFGAFEQADRSTTRKYGGSGLGLAITQHLANLMGGEVGADSVPGIGSTFWFTARLHRGESFVRGASPHVQGRRVLIADDLPEARDVLASMTAGLGMLPTKVADGEMALAAIQQAERDGDPFDFFLLDWRMPGLDGPSTLRRMNTFPLQHAPLALVVTAYDEFSVREEALEAGFQRVLSKPLTASTLVDALANIVGVPKSTSLAADVQCSFDALRRQSQGSRVLIAEDNPVNRDVVLELLAGLGLEIDVAGDGVEAVQKALLGKYDLVLMDMQMPGMDGLEATRRIRALPDWQFTPIVAMTANAFGEHRAACLAAGMNDHISKPVEPALLFATVGKWLPTRLDVGARAVLLADETAPSTGLTTAGLYLRRLKMLTHGKREVMRRVLLQFVSYHSADMERLSACIAAADWAGAFHIAHAIKGSAGQIGAGELQACARDIEISLRAGQVAARHELENFKSQLTLAMAQATAWIDAHPVEPEPAERRGERQDVLAKLAQLQALLEASDAHALAVAEVLVHEMPTQAIEVFKSILESIRCFELDGAARQLSSALPAFEEALA